MDNVIIGPNTKNYYSEIEFPFINSTTGKTVIRFAEDYRVGRVKEGKLLGTPVIYVENSGDPYPDPYFPCHLKKETHQSMREGLDVNFKVYLIKPLDYDTFLFDKIFSQESFNTDGLTKPVRTPLVPPTAVRNRERKTSSYELPRDVVNRAVEIDGYVNKIFFDSNLRDKHGYWFCSGCSTNFKGPGGQYHKTLLKPCEISDKKTFIGNRDLVYLFGPNDQGDKAHRATRKIKDRGRSLFEDKAEVKMAIQVWNEQHQSPADPSSSKKKPEEGSSPLCSWESLEAALKLMDREEES